MRCRHIYKNNDISFIKKQIILRFVVKEVKTVLSDIPTPSLYRHIKILAEHAVIVVAEENRVRGTVESVYQLNPKGLAVEDGGGLAIQTSLMSIGASFAKYFVNSLLECKNIFEEFCKSSAKQRTSKSFYNFKAVWDNVEPNQVKDFSANNGAIQGQQ